VRTNTYKSLLMAILRSQGLRDEREGKAKAETVATHLKMKQGYSRSPRPACYALCFGSLESSHDLRIVSLIRPKYQTREGQKL
jgi:hypothetical protein